MEPGYSIQLIWSLAAREGVKSGKEFIEPEHLFNGLLKFAELNSTNLELIRNDRETLNDLEADQEEVLKMLRGRGFSIPRDTTDLRRRLRSLMGHGAFTHEAKGVPHRSEASRQLCRRAEELAKSEGVVSWQGRHLAIALMENPQGYLALALKPLKNNDPPAGELLKNKKTPLLQRYGRLLGPIEPAASSKKIKEPAARVILDNLERRQGSHLLLVEAGRIDALKILEEVASQGGGTLIRINLSDLTEDQREEDNLITDIYQEAAEIGAVIFLEGLAEWLGKEEHEVSTVALERALSAKKVICIAVLTEIAYGKLVSLKSPLGRLFKPLWLHPQPMLPW